MDGPAVMAIRHALSALRRRHLLEEGAHIPAFSALSRQFVTQGSEWKEKAEGLEVELQQCYKAQARLSEQLVVEVAECRDAKALLQEKETSLNELQKEVAEGRDEISKLKELLEENRKALDLAISENQELRSQLEEEILKARNAESENKMLIDRWMMQKMQDAERLNEANAIYKEMMDKLKASNMQQLVQQQVDGVVRLSETWTSEALTDLPSPTWKHRLQAHEGACGSILFEPNSDCLITGGLDQIIRVWDTRTGTNTNTLTGCLGSILDLAIARDKCIIAATSSNKMFVFDQLSRRLSHTLTGHLDKVCAVDASKVSGKSLVSAAYDRTIRTWDLVKGYCTATLMCHSNCNALCYGIDGQTVFTGHVDGNLRLWDLRVSGGGKMVSEVAAHAYSVTSVSLSRGGLLVLTSGRDNVHNLFDVRASLEVCGNFRGGSGSATNWNRSCISPDDNYVVAGSSDGMVHVWSRREKGEIVSMLRGHEASVLTCAWSDTGGPLASADKKGAVYLWV
ncbi:hypothetical protein AMTRI_Chr12g274490 [Amborella trichopoda]|uniref:Autophagy-related protein 16 domain-containing protein n=1 Tax=Amborella trichopoda TaxID=13333 RepID=W1PI49_AMBTC|nr:autophagy-related protein 16 [Amborella trichopoda]XP_011623833.1 autophagy-related protein 16 [Amborella trichopoda]XP_020523778.1 autophagy-related protein 16 [Amborella trichopoda]XP_020523779.1 autophagy-related protein 16 [Amborella trichopoda]XP_020523780.1 autophagy-related protein 16 [Amborella trichopoda]XP_020523781.1 autophagy-related protein 16 [Amborella trichopoda]ERN07301.1 hypothetical protein AMTR_s00019p00218240 [Amborella trichopoda]|eukprot:XP_006845626.1 autophagy-related protein 16 [Amborella trichopoda]